ncbi:MAG TPA: zinc ABC transporter substrate-binding protein [Candidatus Thermoplasmatota archaeon]|nr:zinc ABC transporter substrate-binding protein [Candidatus Thermoplasmatota archaeon]
MRRGLVALLLVALLTPAFAGCATPEQTEKADVVATFYPLRFFAARVAGENLTVASLIPDGVEPHDWEPRPRDVAVLGGAKVFVYNGAGFEPWVGGLLEKSENPNLKVVDASAHAEPVALEAEAEEEENAPHEEEHGHGHGHEEGEGELDPHFWLDPVRSQAVVRAIAQALRDADPANAAAYQARAERLQEDLQALDVSYRDGLAGCTKREILATHDAFSYLSRRYNFTVHSLSGVSPEAQPSAQKMQQLVDLARSHEIRYVFFETLVSADVAEAIAREVGAETLVLNPVEGLTPDQAKAGEDYFSLMRANLANLRTAMECP